MSAQRVEIIGAGIAGAACARALSPSRIPVVVRERGRAPGGRMAAPTLHGRRVDLGAAYFTAADDLFGALVTDWQERGLARAWTDTLSVAGGEPTSGPMRWSAPDGLRSLVRDLLGDLAVSVSDPVSADMVRDADHPVVLAMPDPQAARLLGSVPGVSWVEYEPVVTVVLGFASRCWAFPDAAFVNDDPDISLVTDDGSRRGDGAPVLVVHTSADLARAHLDDPDGVVPAVLAALRRTVGVDDVPDWTHVHRWTFAKPAGTHGDSPYALTDSLVGICGDAWCPSGSPRVESAWLSGHRLGVELAHRLS